MIGTPAGASGAGGQIVMARSHFQLYQAAGVGSLDGFASPGTSLTDVNSA